MFEQLLKWFKARLHIKAATLKHSPFVTPGSEQALADHANALVGAAVDDAAASAVPIAANALHLKGAQLKGAPGIVGEQHDVAAAVINSLVTSKLAELETPAP